MRINTVRGAPIRIAAVRYRSSLATPTPGIAAVASTSAIPLASSPAAALPSATQQARVNVRRASSSLPPIKDQRLTYLGVAALALGAWAGFLAYAFSAEKGSSSVVRGLAFQLRSSPLVKEALGEGVKPKPMFFSTEPWVRGTVNTLQGIVDINFRVHATNGREATVYFKSLRPSKNARFETKEFRILVDGDPVPLDLSREDYLQGL